MSYQNNGYNSSYKKRTVSPYVIFALAGLFFVALMYEVTSDGVTALFEWLPAIEWANMAGDVVVNVLQIAIFSFVAALTGSPYKSGQTSSGHYQRASNVPEFEHSERSEDQKRRMRDTERYGRQMKKENRKSYRKNKR